MNHLEQLQSWYLAHCDGDWEHSYGVKIDTLDNPGWSLEIDIVDTELEHKRYIGKRYSINEQDWAHCRVEEKKFRATGSPSKLVELIEEFLRWKDEQIQSGDPI